MGTLVEGAAGCCHGDNLTYMYAVGCVRQATSRAAGPGPYPGMMGQVQAVYRLLGVTRCVHGHPEGETMAKAYKNED
ncbi:hypothetical protein NJB18091_32890 [Mycobacterium marinum]|nr:hypothetical protein NJB18091_32890 [Mycobacterium marinum]GJO20091.1 hypothetical protein NJB1507_15410 [Mycobacterium marinum]GJO42684.1 hypothetical protein NJB1604_17080 [Mycobacterium marinum]